jgi:hypothetical protein
LEFASKGFGKWQLVIESDIIMTAVTWSGFIREFGPRSPNYAHSHIPLYSFPHNGLWRERWCSDETMAEGKTIDLCNNPLTKTMKLFIAQTRIVEWGGLDEEAKAINSGADKYKQFLFNHTQSE